LSDEKRGASDEQRKLRSLEGVWDPDLIERASAGDACAAEELIQRYGPTINKIIDSRLAGSGITDKEDIYQEAWEHVIKAIRERPCKVKKEAAFSRRLVLGTTMALAKHLRARVLRRRAYSDDMDLWAFWPPEGPDNVETDLTRVLKVLSQPERELVKLAYGGHSKREMASMLGLSRNTLYRRLNSLHRKLMLLLG